MGRARLFEMGCLNIRVHTRHHPEEYEQLWRELVRMRMPHVSRGGNALMIGEARPVDLSPTAGIYGYIYRFVEINQDDPWFDIRRHRPADEEDVAAVNIPSNLRANLSQVPYFFDVVRHRLYIVSRDQQRTLSPAAVLRLLTVLTQRPEIVGRFGHVEMQVATEVEQVTEMLSWPVINRMRIAIERPNATDFEDEGAVFDYLSERQLGKEVRTYVKAPGAQSIVPDEDMRALAAVAADNGVVHVEGYDRSDHKRKADSQQFAWSKRVNYNPQTQTLADAFMESVRDLFTRRRI